MGEIAEELLDKIKSAARMKINRGQGLRTRLRMQREQAEAGPKIKPYPRRNQQTTTEAIVMGVSTGGPGTIEEIVHGLPADFPVPIVVAQHMPQRFTQVFADRLNKSSALTVKEVSSLTN